MIPATTKESESSSLAAERTCRHLSLDQIRSATKNFNKSLIVGRGGFGKVYKGHIDQGSVVAIKRLNSMSNQGALEFRAEVEMLSKLRHCNIVSLIGYCNEGREMILVYDYMSHGTLEERLDKSALPLTWLQRLKICIGSARGLDYLHNGTGTRQGVIHRDVKSSNILLDENLAAKISDFGLAKIGPINQTCTCVSTMVKGTFGYMDPYYFHTGKLTRKSDVYAFGVVLLEIICGKRVYDSSLGEWGMATWAQDHIKEGKLKRIIDSRIRENISSNCLKKFADIACRCLHNQPSERPTMAEIIVRLERILFLQEKMDSSVTTDGKFINKLRSFFPSRIQLKPNKWMSTPAASNEGEPSDDRAAEVTGQLIHFDASSFTLEDLMQAPAFVIRKSRCWKAYRLIMESGKELLLTRLTSNLLLEDDIVLEKVVALGKLCHPNILVPNAYYHIKHTKFFVNDYNHLYGSVSSLLHTSEGQLPKPLGWSTRMSIIVGITRGLVYLHTEEYIVHGYLTSGNVLLDRDYKPMIADVGLSLLLKDDFKFQDANMKTDIYNIGLIMLELLTRKSTKLGKEGMDLCTWVMSVPKEDSRAVLFDPQLKREKSDIKLELALTLQLAMSCVSLNPDARPTADQVLQRLEKILAIAQKKKERKKHVNLFSISRDRFMPKRSDELHPVNLVMKVEKKFSLSFSSSRDKRPLRCGQKQRFGRRSAQTHPQVYFKKNLHEVSWPG